MSLTKGKNKTSYVQVTRIYRVGTDESVSFKTQKVSVCKNFVIKFRPSNALGEDSGHRSTITTSDGRDINVSDKYSELKRMF